MKNILLRLKNCGWKSVAALALSVVVAGQNSACFFLAHQDEVPEGAKKYRRF